LFDDAIQVGQTLKIFTFVRISTIFLLLAFYSKALKFIKGSSSVYFYLL